jgi:hypothetical protein
MHAIVYPRYTLVEKIIIGIFSLITWPLQWLVGKTREKMHDLEIKEYKDGMTSRAPSLLYAIIRLVRDLLSCLANDRKNDTRSLLSNFHRG